MNFIKFQAYFFGILLAMVCGFIATLALVCFLFISVLGLIQVFTDIEIWKNQIFPWTILFGSIVVGMIAASGFQIGYTLHEWGDLP